MGSSSTWGKRDDKVSPADEKFNGNVKWGSVKLGASIKSRDEGRKDEG
jgi:hypothetical protein